MSHGIRMSVAAKSIERWFANVAFGNLRLYRVSRSDNSFIMSINDLRQCRLSLAIYVIVNFAALAAKLGDAAQDGGTGMFEWLVNHAKSLAVPGEHRRGGLRG